MDLLTILMATLFTCIGVWTLNLDGSFTTHLKSRLIGLALHVSAMLMLMNVYGNFRGFFVFVALASVVGMFFTMLSYYVFDNRQARQG